MNRDKIPNLGLPPAEKVSEEQIRRSYAETADRSGSLPILDLHGKRAHETYALVDNFILTQNSKDDTFCCRIDHGKGAGVLKEIVEKVIKDLTTQGIINYTFQSSKFPDSIVIVFHP